MKLVPDRTRDVLAGRPLRLTFTPADPSRRREPLFGKLLAEAGEWLAARNAAHAAVELADLQGLVWELAALDGVSADALVADA